MPESDSLFQFFREISGLKLRFHDLRHTCITKVAETTASDQTIMAIAGHVSHKMMEHYSHIRMEAKRVALDAIAKAPNPAIIQAGVHQNGNQPSEGEKVRLASCRSSATGKIMFTTERTETTE